MGTTSGIMWLLLAQSASAGLLSGQVLEEICGTQDLTLSPANPCFFRLFSMAQVWDECERHKDGKSCLASCFSASYCESLCEHSQSAKCEAQCPKLVACMEDVNGAAATRSCFGGSMPSSSEDERSPLEDWLSLAGVGTDARRRPTLRWQRRRRRHLRRPSLHLPWLRSLDIRCPCRWRQARQRCAA